MRIPARGLEPGVLPNSRNFFFASPLTEQECNLFYYIPWCGHFFCTEKYFHKRDYFPYCLLMYVQQGLFHIEYRGNVFDAQAGDVILLDLTEPHFYSAYDGLEFLYFCFNGSNSHELCQYYLKNDGPLIRTDKNFLIRNYLANTIAFYDTNPYESIPDTSMRVYKCINLLFTQEHEYSISSDNAIEHALRHIHENIHKKLTLQELAGLVHLNPCYFSHLFKRKTGLSPIEYVINVRMNQAKLMLITTDKAIIDIAYEVGYSSGASFTNVFTDRIGCSPRQFRKLMR